MFISASIYRNQYNNDKQYMFQKDGNANAREPYMNIENTFCNTAVSNSIRFVIKNSKSQLKWNVLLKIARNLCTNVKSLILEPY